MAVTLAPPRLPKRINLGVPSDEEEQPISDAQASDLGQDNTGLTLSSGYTSPVVPPGGVMGGQETQPDDFSQKVRAATAVESKGGPPLSELSAKAGKGPIQRSNGPTLDLGKLPPEDTVAKGTPAGSAEPVKKAQSVTGERPGMTVQPGETPSTVTPGKTVGTVAGPEAPAPAGTPDQELQQMINATPGYQAPAPAQPAEKIPAPPQLLDPKVKARIMAQGGDKFLDPVQDYSKVSEDDLNDPLFAGVSISDADHPARAVFMDDRGLYIRDLKPGQEIKHYANARYGDPDYETGVVTENPEQKKMYDEASGKLTGILKAQDALQDFRNQVTMFQMANGNINIAQAQILAAQNNPEAAWWQKALARVAGGGKFSPLEITDKMRDLEAARQRLGREASIAIIGGLPAREGMRYAPNTPDVNDSLETQLQKASALERDLNGQVNAIYSQNPKIARFLKEAQANQQRARATSGAGAATNTNQPQAGASPSPSPTPSATPGAPTYEEAQAAPRIKSHADLEGKPKGFLYRDTDGTLKRLGY